MKQYVRENDAFCELYHAQNNARKRGGRGQYDQVQQLVDLSRAKTSTCMSDDLEALNPGSGAPGVEQTPLAVYAVRLEQGVLHFPLLPSFI